MMLKGEGSVFVETIFGHNTRQPLVKLTWVTPAVSQPLVMISPENATELAMNLLQAAQASLTDAFLVSFMEDHVKADPEHVALVLQEFRKWRQGREMDE